MGDSLLDRVHDGARAIRELQTALRVLYWDGRVHATAHGSAWRTAQRMRLAAIIHRTVTDEAWIELLNAAIAEHGSLPELRVLLADAQRASQLPAASVTEYERISSEATAAWHAARSANDWSVYEASFTAMVDAARRRAELLGYDNEPYDALVAEWEPGSTAASLDALLSPLAPLLAPLRPSRPQRTKSVTQRSLDRSAMVAIEAELLEAFGFDASRGVVADAERAFCVSLGPDDVRIATRFHRNRMLKGLHSTLHEAGHAIYRQRFAPLGVSDALAQPPGLGIDESQSRLFENWIGRDSHVLGAIFERLYQLSPGTYAANERDAFVEECRTAESPTRRLGSDEIDYTLHILLRMKLERQLMNGDLRAGDVPNAWRDASAHFLGEAPRGLLDGCLQDIHWALGQWGYFPTYAIGNIMAAQLMEAADAAGAGLSAIRAAENLDCSPLVDWLDNAVYRHGRTLSGPEIVEQATGEPVTSDAFVRYLHERYASTA